MYEKKKNRITFSPCIRLHTIRHRGAQNDLYMRENSLMFLSVSADAARGAASAARSCIAVARMQGRCGRDHATVEVHVLKRTRVRGYPVGISRGRLSGKWLASRVRYDTQKFTITPRGCSAVCAPRHAVDDTVSCVDESLSGVYRVPRVAIARVNGAPRGLRRHKDPYRPRGRRVVPALQKRRL